MTDAKNWEIGLSTGWQGKASRETFEFYRDNGIENIEVSMGHDNFLKIDWDEVGKNARECGINLWSVHLPFMPYKIINFGDTAGPAREYTIQMAKNAIDRMGEQKIPHLVIHSGVDMYDPENREKCMQNACAALAELAEYGAPKGVTICVENMPRTGLGNTIEEMKRLVASHPALRVCFDTNHLLRNRHVDFVRELGDKIVTLHVSDYDFHDERHVFPYEGDIKWIELVEELEKVNYNGVWMYECGLGERKAVIRERPVTAADLKENHRCLMNKEVWPKFSKGDEEFCKAHTFIENPEEFHGPDYKRG